MKTTDSLSKRPQRITGILVLLVLSSYQLLAQSQITNDCSCTNKNKSIYLGPSAGGGTGERNVMIGKSAGDDNTSGAENVFVGRQSGRQNTEGSQNVYLGKKAGFHSNKGDRNTFIGTEAGHEHTNGHGNVYIGYQAGYKRKTSNLLYIENSDGLSPLIYGDFSRRQVAINTHVMPEDFTFAVNGDAIMERVVVQKKSDWPDYVFADDYELAPLSEVAAFIQAHRHLSEIPSAQVIDQEGLDLGEMEVKMMKKIEELTLYLIAMEKQNAQLQTAQDQLSKKLQHLEAQLPDQTTAH